MIRHSEQYWRAICCEFFFSIGEGIDYYGNRIKES
jgi:hypothetical protein